jgi:hypothetical protein
MLVFLIIAAVLIGLAYADFCLIDNTEHFGMCFKKAAEAGAARAEKQAKTVASMWNSSAEQTEVVPPSTGGMESADERGTDAAADNGKSTYLRRRPVPEPLLLLDLEPVLELYEA